MQSHIVRRVVASGGTLVMLLALCAAAEAQPSVSSTSGQWSHKATITVSGSGFGSKPTPQPVIFDDASGTSMSATGWSGAWPNNNSAYNLTYRAPQRGINLPHSRITRYIAGAHGDSAGPQGGYSVIMFKTRTMTAPGYTYATWYERCDDAWSFGGDDNFKTYAYSTGSTPYELPNNWYIEYNPRPTSRTSGPAYHINDDNGSLQSPDANGHGWWWSGAINPMSGVWKKVEVEARYTNASDGYIKVWENGTLKVDYKGPTDRMSGTQRTEGVGGYARNYGKSTNWRYFADVYLDHSRARVILGNAATLASSTVREVQVPTAWSATSVTLSANLGSFSNGQSVYLYVVDPNGTANPQGYPVTLGTATSDTTPPTVSASAPVNGAVNVAVTTTVRATFNEAMNASTITAANVELRTSTNALVAAALTYDAGTRVATLTPSGALGNSATYTAMVRGGSSGVKDVAGNALAANHSWSFTTASTTPPPPTGDVVLKLGFDEGSGTVVNDTSGFNNDGVVTGSTWTTGRFGSGLLFDGVNDWVTIGDDASLDLAGGLTVEAWLRPTSLSGWRTALMKETADGLAYGLYAHDNNPWPAAYVRIAGSSVSEAIAGPGALPLNAWTHLAVTYDGTTLRLFVNGLPSGSEPASGPITTSSGPLRIGGNAIWEEHFTGVIDEVRVYNRALSQSEIQTDMATSIGGTTDTTPPTVSSVFPAPAAPVVALNATVTGTFSEPMQAATVTGTTFELRVVSSGALVASTVAFNSSTNVATLTPNSLLVNGTQYRATIKGGAAGVKDAAGNGMAADHTWTFTAATTPAPPTNLRIIR